MPHKLPDQADASLFYILEATCDSIRDELRKIRDCFGHKPEIALIDD